MFLNNWFETQNNNYEKTAYKLIKTLYYIFEKARTTENEIIKVQMIQ